MIRFLAILIVILVGAAEPALAYGHRSCFDLPLRFRGEVGTVGIWGASFPVGAWRDGATDGFRKINDHPGNYRLDMNVDTFHVSPGNGESEMWFSPDALWNGDGSALAIYYDICFPPFAWHVNEVDVIIDSRVPYTPSQNKRNLWFYDNFDGGRPLQPIMIHELSHGLGFTHNDYNYNVMGTDFTHLHVNGSLAQGYVGEDLAAGIVRLYGPKRSYEDVAVAHWRYSGRSGEYSMHSKTEFVALPIGPSRFIDGEDYFEVTPGQWIMARFTYENLGLTCQNTAVGLYVSTNSTISTSDRRIGGQMRRLCPATPDTRAAFVRLPDDLPRGRQMWLGVIVNEDRAFSEVSATNNATYIPMWVN